MWQEADRSETETDTMTYMQMRGTLNSTKHEYPEENTVTVERYTILTEHFISYIEVIKAYLGNIN